VQLLRDPVNRSERVRIRISQQVCKMAGVGVDYRGRRWLGELLVSLNCLSRVNGVCIPQVEVPKRRTNDQRHGSRKKNKTLNEQKCRNKNGEQVTGKGMGGGAAGKAKAEHIQPTTASPQSMPEQQKTCKTPRGVLTVANDKLLICPGSNVFVGKTIGFQQKTRLEYDL